MGLVISANRGRRREFLDAFGTLEGAAGASEKAWARLGLLRHSGANDIFAAAPGEGAREPAHDLRDPGKWIASELRMARERGCRILCMDDGEYPERLRTLPDPPPVLYVRGDARWLAWPSIAIVGARRATRYGLSTASRLGGDLAARGIAIVSGGARGVDASAHRGALAAGGGTVAVMGSGLDRPYPPEHEALFDEIAASGAVISEFPMGFAPEPYRFPIRNRLIAGLSLGVVVVEGKLESGSMITARHAVDCGREVFAVPGPITSPLSDGPHALIQTGAKLVRGVDDILEEIPREAILPQRPIPLVGAVEGGADPSRGPAAAAGDARLDALLGSLDAHSGRSADDLSAALGMATGELLGALMELELKGLVEQAPGGLFVRRM